MITSEDTTKSPADGERPRDTESGNTERKYINHKRKKFSRLKVSEELLLRLRASLEEEEFPTDEGAERLVDTPIPPSGDDGQPGPFLDVMTAGENTDDFFVGHFHSPNDRENYIRPSTLSPQTSSFEDEGIYEGNSSTGGASAKIRKGENHLNVEANHIEGGAFDVSLEWDFESGDGNTLEKKIQHYDELVSSVSPSPSSDCDYEESESAASSSSSSSSSSDSGAVGSLDLSTQEGAIQAISHSFSWLEEELFSRQPDSDESKSSVNYDDDEEEDDEMCDVVDGKSSNPGPLVDELDNFIDECFQWDDVVDADNSEEQDGELCGEIIELSVDGSKNLASSTSKDRDVTDHQKYECNDDGTNAVGRGVINAAYNDAKSSNLRFLSQGKTENLTKSVDEQDWDFAFESDVEQVSQGMCGGKKFKGNVSEIEGGIEEVCAIDDKIQANTPFSNDEELLNNVTSSQNHVDVTNYSGAMKPDVVNRNRLVSSPFPSSLMGTGSRTSDEGDSYSASFVPNADALSVDMSGEENDYRSSSEEVDLSDSISESEWSEAETCILNPENHFSSLESKNSYCKKSEKYILNGSNIVLSLESSESEQSESDNCVSNSSNLSNSNSRKSDARVLPTLNWNDSDFRQCTLYPDTEEAHLNVNGSSKYSTSDRHYQGSMYFQPELADGGDTIDDNVSLGITEYALPSSFNGEKLTRDDEGSTSPSTCTSTSSSDVNTSLEHDSLDLYRRVNYTNDADKQRKKILPDVCSSCHLSEGKPSGNRRHSGTCLGCLVERDLGKEKGRQVRGERPNLSADGGIPGNGHVTLRKRRRNRRKRKIGGISKREGSDGDGGCVRDQKDVSHCDIEGWVDSENRRWYRVGSREPRKMEKMTVANVTTPPFIAPQDSDDDCDVRWFGSHNMNFDSSERGDGSLNCNLNSPEREINMPINDHYHYGRDIDRTGIGHYFPTIPVQNGDLHSMGKVFSRSSDVLRSSEREFDRLSGDISSPEREICRPISDLYYPVTRNIPSDPKENNDWFDDPYENSKWEQIRKRLLKTSSNRMRKISVDKDALDSWEETDYPDSPDHSSSSQEKEKELSVKIKESRDYNCRSDTAQNQYGWSPWSFNDLDVARVHNNDTKMRGGDFNDSFEVASCWKYFKLEKPAKNDTPGKQKPPEGHPEGAKDFEDQRKGKFLADVGYNSEFEGGDSDSDEYSEIGSDDEEGVGKEFDEESEEDDDLAEKTLDSLRFLNLYRGKQDTRDKGKSKCKYTVSSFVECKGTTLATEKGNERRKRTLVMLGPLNDVDVEKEMEEHGKSHKINDVPNLVPSCNPPPLPPHTSVPPSPSRDGTPLNDTFRPARNTSINPNWDTPIYAQHDTYARYDMTLPVPVHTFASSALTNRDTDDFYETRFPLCEVFGDEKLKSTQSSKEYYSEESSRYGTKDSVSHYKSIFRPNDSYGFNSGTPQFQSPLEKHRQKSRDEYNPMYYSHDWNGIYTFNTPPAAFTLQTTQSLIHAKSSFDINASSQAFSPGEPRLVWESDSHGKKSANFKKSVDDAASFEQSIGADEAYDIDGRCFAASQRSPRHYPLDNEGPYVSSAPSAPEIISGTETAERRVISDADELTARRETKGSTNAHDHFRKNDDCRAANMTVRNSISRKNFKCEDTDKSECSRSNVFKGQLDTTSEFFSSRHPRNRDDERRNNFAYGNSISGYAIVSDHPAEDQADGWPTASAAPSGYCPFDLSSFRYQGNFHEKENTDGITAVDNYFNLDRKAEGFFPPTQNHDINTKTTLYDRQTRLDQEPVHHTLFNNELRDVCVECNRNRERMANKLGSHANDITPVHYGPNVAFKCTCLSNRPKSPRSFYNDIMSRERFWNAVKSDSNNQAHTPYWEGSSTHKFPERSENGDSKTIQSDGTLISPTSHKWLRAIPASCLSHTLCARYPLYKKIRNALCKSDNVLASTASRLQGSAPIQTQPKSINIHNRNDAGLVSSEQPICSQPKSIRNRGLMGDVSNVIQGSAYENRNGGLMGDVSNVIQGSAYENRNGGLMGDVSNVIQGSAYENRNGGLMGDVSNVIQGSAYENRNGGLLGDVSNVIQCSAYENRNEGLMGDVSNISQGSAYEKGSDSDYLYERRLASYFSPLTSLQREPPDGTSHPDDPVEKKAVRVDKDHIVCDQDDERDRISEYSDFDDGKSSPIRMISPLELWDPGPVIDSIENDDRISSGETFSTVLDENDRNCGPSVERVAKADLTRHEEREVKSERESEDHTTEMNSRINPSERMENKLSDRKEETNLSFGSVECQEPRPPPITASCRPTRTIIPESPNQQSTILLAVDSLPTATPAPGNPQQQQQQPSSLIDLMKLGHYEGYVTLPMVFKPVQTVNSTDIDAALSSQENEPSCSEKVTEVPSKIEPEEISQSTQVRVSLRKYCKRKKDGSRKLVIKFTLCLECAGCKEELVEGQALIALDQQWHIWCFKCAACNTVLHGEYMGKDGLPYCEKDYQAQFGVKCAYCNRFISGKVLQAGDNHHFHPTCARCTKCGDPFGDGEEMYLQGTAIWHPRCGPGPTENGTVLNGSISNGHHVNGDQKVERERDFDGLSSTASETQFSRSRTPSLNGSFRSYSPYNSLSRKFSGPYRTCSPGLILREYKSSQSPVDITRIYTYSYLTAEPSQGYLKRPLDPYDRPPPKSPHFHRPPPDYRKLSLPKTNSRLGMRVLVDQMQTETPRPKSPHMNNEEPIALSHYPGGRKPPTGDVSRIERDDFPAPPYPYTDPDVSERRRRWSGSTKAVSIDETDEATELEDDETLMEDPKLKKEEVELSKIATGIGKVFLQQVKEREKIRAWKATHLDPRNASRSPAADREPGNKLRFGTSLNASPSRMTDHNRPWGPEDDEFDRGSSYRCSTGRSSATIPSYNVVSALRGEPKPGYGLKSSTLPAAGRNGGSAGLIGDYSFSGLGEKTQSTEFSSARSDVSAGSLTDADRSALNAELCASTTYSSGLRGYSSYSPHLRRSLPNMHHMSSEPPKIYPAHLLLVSNYRLPNDVDRCHLERHLSDTDFEMVFHMTRMDFYRLPEWRRNDLKRRAKFF